VLACQKFDGSVVYLPVQPEVYNYLPKRMVIEEGQSIDLITEPGWIPVRTGQGAWRDAFPV